ncbi:hypothetical protein EGW08_012326, partial [Elysia chlorotica]
SISISILSRHIKPQRLGRQNRGIAVLCLSPLGYRLKPDPSRDTMAFVASLLSVALMVILDHQLTAAQVFTTYPLSAQGTCISAGLFPNPADCNGYLQCAPDQPHPYVKKCSPGTLFHPERRECLGENSVVCYPRPRTDQMIHTAFQTAIHPAILPTVYQAVGTHVVTTGSNSVVLRLMDPVLRSDQCSSIAQQMTRYIRQLVNNAQPACTANTACQNNLPVFHVQCLTSTGRVLL